MLAELRDGKFARCAGDEMTRAIRAGEFLSVDVHIPGCPPRPEALIHAFMTLQRKIDEQKLTGPNRPRHLVAGAPSEFPIPQFGEHDLVPPSNPNVWQPPKVAR